MKEFEYDVAFSFTAQDEGRAVELNDLISSRLKTFIYSERQKEIAGTDGQASFSEVYGNTARLVVVMYRPDWGQTRWTRIEMDAIKNRSLDEGWDFTVFIPTGDEQPKMPPWVPKTRLYVGLERWGPQGAAAVIEARVAEQGGQPHQETVPERAARFARASELKERQRLFLNSDLGVKAATEAYEGLSAALEANCEVVAESGVKLRTRRADDLRIVSGAGPVNLICYWRPDYSNSLEEIFLKATFYKGFPKLPGFMPSFNDAQQLRSLQFSYELVRPEYHAYVGTERSERREYSPQQLADYLLGMHMDLSEKNPRHG